MRKLLPLAIVAIATVGAFAEDAETLLDRTVVDPDFGLALLTPEGFEAEMVGQTDDGAILITVLKTEGPPTAIEPGGDLCEITFYYDPAYGQGDQAWVNSLVDGTGFYEMMARDVVVPGSVVESSEDFSHNGSSAHRFLGSLEQGGSFLVAAIPSPEGYSLVTCMAAEANETWDAVQPLIDAIVVPGQPRDGLVASGECDAEPTAAAAILREREGGDFDGTTIAELDQQRTQLVGQCGPLHAEAIMDGAVDDAGLSSSYRAFRYDALAGIGADLMTAEQHAALAEARQQVEAGADEGTGERYIRYMHFIVGLRSLTL